MKHIMLIICLLAVVVFSGCMKDKSYAEVTIEGKKYIFKGKEMKNMREAINKIHSKNEKERVSKFPNPDTIGPKWRDKKTFVFYGNLKILSIKHDVEYRRFLGYRKDIYTMDTSTTSGNVTFTTNLKITKGLADIYQKYEIGKEYFVQVIVSKGGFQSYVSLIYFYLGDNPPILCYTDKAFASKLIKDIETHQSSLLINLDE
jgi:hypothetical protein